MTEAELIYESDKARLADLDDDAVYEWRFDDDRQIHRATKREIVKRTPKQIRLAPNYRDEKQTYLPRQRLEAGEIVRNGKGWWLPDFVFGWVIRPKLKEQVVNSARRLQDCEARLLEVECALMNDELVLDRQQSHLMELLVEALPQPKKPPHSPSVDWQKCPVYEPTWIPHDGTSKRTTVLVTAPVVDHDHDQIIADVEMPVSAREQMARRYLKSVPGTQQGTGADGRCSALTMKLLYGFALPVELVQEMLEEWGQKEDQLDDAGGWYPWADTDIVRKIEWCLGQEYRGKVGDRLDPPRELSDMEAEAEITISFRDFENVEIKIL